MSYKRFRGNDWTKMEQLALQLHIETAIERPPVLEVAIPRYRSEFKRISESIIKRIKKIELIN